MCLLKVLDHTGRGGCGHFFILEIRQCTETRFRLSRDRCIRPPKRTILPGSDEFCDLVRWFDAGHNKAAGKCAVCQGEVGLYTSL